MIDGIEDLYQQIAESMRGAIPEDWITAKFEAIFYPDGSTYEAEYIRKMDGGVRGFQPTSSGSRAFRQLRKKFKESGQQLWGRACVELHIDGKFNIQWGYDNCDQNGDTVFDEEKEIKRHEERRNRLSNP